VPSIVPFVVCVGVADVACNNTAQTAAFESINVRIPQVNPTSFSLAVVRITSGYDADEFAYLPILS
jgi:hypothetical protein